MVVEFSRQELKKHYNRKTIRKLKDMSELYKDASGYNPNKILYNVYIMDFDCYETGLTVIEPGTINKEYIMTKGHKHKKATKEIYILLNGKGKLMIKGKSTKVFDLKKGETYVLPKNAGHRLINTGNKKLEVLTIYSKSAGHAYGFKFDRRFFKK